MEIARLEITGFKSFPDRTQLVFGPGISCVVGPNGSGKSNVVDALRWCIGEQSARRLRGQDMSDVIFNGSADRAPRGFAEVCIVLRAGDGAFPGDYAGLEEIEISRRLHRTGASEYLINAVRVRRRDVQDVFLDTGVGVNLYSFIEQGRVDQLIQASPAERRVLFDQVAGIGRYRARREEAKRRLDDTCGQLDRAADVADEMGRRLALLNRQVGRVVRFKMLRGRVRYAEIVLGLVRYRELFQDRRALRERKTEAKGRLETLQGHVKERTAERDERRGEIEVLEGRVSALRDELAEVDAQRREQIGIQRLQADRSVELLGLAAQTERANDGTRSRLEELQAILAASEVSLQQAREGAAEAEAALEKAVAAARAATDERNAMSEAANETRAVLEATRADLIEARGGLSDASSACAALRATRARLENELARLGQERAAMDDRCVELRLAVQQSQAAGETARTAHELAASVHAQTSAEHEHLQQHTKACEAKVVAIQRAPDDAAVQQLREDAERVAASLAEAEARRASFEDGYADGERVRDQALAQAAANADREADDKATLRLQALAKEQEQTRTAFEAQARETLAAEEARLAHRLQEISRAGRVRMGRAVEAAESLAGIARAQALADVNQTTAQNKERQAYGRRIEADLAEMEQREAALAATLEALEADVGSSIPTGLRAVLDGLTSVEDEEDWREDWGALVGERRGLAVVDAEIAVRLANALGAGPPQRFLLRGGGQLSEQLLAQLHRADGPEDAIAHHLSSGGEVVDTQTGLRISADGVLTVGDGQVSAQRRLARRRQRLEAVQELETVCQSLETLRAERDRHEDATRRGEDALDVASRRYREVMEDVGSGVEEAREAARVENDAQYQEAQVADAQALQAHRDEVEEQRQALRVAQEEARVDVDRSLRGERVALREEATHRTRDKIAQTASSARRALEEAREVEQALRLEWKAQQTAVARSIDEQRVTRAASVAEHSAVLDEARGRQEACALVLEAHLRGLLEAKAALRETQTQRSNASQACDVATQRHETLETRYAAIANQIRSDEQAHRALEETRQGFEDSAQSLAQKEEVLRDALNVHLEAYESSTLRGLGVDERERESAIHHVRCAERAAGLEVTLLAAREEQTRLTDDLGAQALNREEQAVGARKAEEASRQAAERVVQLDTQRQERWDGLEHQRATLRERKDALEAVEAKLRQRALELETAQRSVSGVSMSFDELKVELEVLRQRTEERYQVSLPAMLDRLEVKKSLVIEGVASGSGSTEVVSDVADETVELHHIQDADHIQSLAEQLQEDQAALARLGEVNLVAFEEHRDLSVRHAELIAQREDLDASVRDLRAAIAKMNRTCRRKFRDAYDDVNERFQASYPRLVGGGAAHLSLTDEVDLLETGVEIYVQPPGKRLQTMSLLSGGEKAMGAIALLVALFGVKPSPFCVLDEVDAPLDEVNGARFNAMLREMSASSQLLVITHNRKTMECADTLVGVTMVAPGVSKVVSVEL